MYRWVPWLAIAFAIAGCEPDEKYEPDTGTPPGPPETTNAQIDVRTIDTSGCTLVPQPRMYAQLTSFVAETPFVPPNQDEEGWTVDRGLLLYGGERGPALNDLWLLDLTNRDRACPWILVHGAALPTGGAYGGGMVYRPSAQTGGPGEFVLVTGFVEDGAEKVSINELYTMPEDQLDVGFQFVTAFGESTHTFVRSDDLLCDALTGPYMCPCVDTGGGCPPSGLWDDDVYMDPCEGTLTWPSGRCRPESDMHLACRESPYCTGDIFPRIAEMPGLGHVAVVYDPATDAITVHGGIAGCETEGCEFRPEIEQLVEAANWNEIETMYPREELAGASRVLSFDFDGGGVFEYPVGAQPYTPGEWPADATIGLGHTAGAVLGTVWNPDTRSFVPDGTPSTYLVGGSVWQSAPPETRYVLTEYVDRNNGMLPYELLDFVAGEWQEVFFWDSTPFNGTLPGPSMMLRYLGGSLGYAPQSVDVPLDPDKELAIAAIEPDAMLIAGAHTLSIVDFDASFAGATRYDLLYPIGTRYAPSVASDPVTRAAYVVAGANAVDTLEIVPPWEILPNASSAFVTLDAEVSYHLVDTGADPLDWTVETAVGLQLLHRCEVPVRSAYPKNLGVSSTDANDLRTSRDCYADSLEVELLGPEMSGGEPSGLTIEVRWDEDEPWRTLDGWTVAGTTATVPLRRTVLDGEELQLRVAFVQSLQIQVTGLEEMDDYPGWQQMPISTTRWLAAFGLPARVLVTTADWISTLGGPDRPPVHQEIVPVSKVWVRHPATMQMAAPAERVTCNGATYQVLAPSADMDADEALTCGATDNLFGAKKWQVSLLPGFERHEVVVDGTPFQLFLDPGLHEDLRGATGEIVSHWTSGMTADLPVLESKLGVFPYADLPVVFHRDPACGVSLAVSKGFDGGTISVARFDCTTGLALVGPTQWKMDLLHELGHAHVGMTVYEGDDDTLWLNEVLPELVALESYPSTSDGFDELARGVQAAVDLAEVANRPSFSVEDMTILQEPGVAYELSAYL